MTRLKGSTQKSNKGVKMMDKLYAERDVFELEPHFSDHVSAMTGEGLHNKADIAAELAFRDAEICGLRERVAELEEAIQYPFTELGKEAQEAWADRNAAARNRARELTVRLREGDAE